MREVAGASSSFVLDDLEPATLYEVYVVASTSKGKGESSQHVEGFTEPPAADELPKPNPPVIVSSPDGSSTIQFSDVLESPYITHILVAVEERRPLARRRRQQAAYGSYAENPSSYIAANISKDDLPIELTIGDNETYGNYHNAPLRDKAIYDVRTGVESNVGGQKSTLFGDSSEVQTGRMAYFMRVLQLKSLLLLNGNSGVPSGFIATVVGGAVGAFFVIVIVIILIIIFYKRRSNESAPAKSKGKESDSSPQYENPVFDPSKTDAHTYQDLHTDSHTYQGVNTDEQSYQNLADPHTYQDLKKPDQEAIYEDVTDAMNRDYVNVVKKN
ncbi:putative tyrosine-protein kinase Wsck [Strongylocentrotus purpuratus]|uniref:Fibronectin type-III domain-containing protein n=1 Tax=Strongylocentrotus purpuratus TaxID=7668 RepID=A0A7M7P239_STRPU|nr:putative tyrosine-protein kinase Wsck [Strongylocentrotus purpuratus]